jgi:hypothetical protein
MKSRMNVAACGGSIPKREECGPDRSFKDYIAVPKKSESRHRGQIWLKNVTRSCINALQDKHKPKKRDNTIENGLAFTCREEHMKSRMNVAALAARSRRAEMWRPVAAG